MFPAVGSGGRPNGGYPVMVFVHGESFSWGSGSLLDGRVLASHGRVVVVTFNYRLGVFGEYELPQVKKEKRAKRG